MKECGIPLLIRFGAWYFNVVFIDSVMLSAQWILWGFRFRKLIEKLQAKSKRLTYSRGVQCSPLALTINVTNSALRSLSFCHAPWATWCVKIYRPMFSSLGTHGLPGEQHYTRTASGDAGMEYKARGTGSVCAGWGRVVRGAWGRQRLGWPGRKGETFRWSETICVMKLLSGRGNDPHTPLLTFA